MKIGLVIERLDPQRGGAEQWTYRHAVGLLQRGHEVHVVTEAVGECVQGHPFVFHILGPIRSRLQRAAAAEAVLRRLPLDIIHDMGMGWHSDILQSEDGSRIAQWERKLLLLPEWARWWKRAMIRLLPRYADFRTLVARQLADPDRIVVAVSKMCAEDYQRYHGLSPKRLRLVYHGTDTCRFSPAHRQQHREPLRARLGIGEEEVVFLFVGHDFVRKGLSVALRSVDSLAARGHPARLLVVGGGKHVDIGRYDKRRIAKSVLFSGRVVDPVPYYCAADAFVLPTFYDPCSLSVGEAAASGLPVVTTRANGASEMITDGLDGYVLDNPADDVALQGHLLRLMDPSLRKAMSAAARQMAMRYPLERNCDEIMSVYEEIICRDERKGPSACLVSCSAARVRRGAYEKSTDHAVLTRRGATTTT